MAGEMSWRLPWGRLTERSVQDAVRRLVAPSDAMTFEVDVEEPSCISVFLHVQDPDDAYTVELSFYDLDSGDVVMAVEEEWSDNSAAWDAACSLAEELAEAVGGVLLDDD